MTRDKGTDNGDGPNEEHDRSAAVNEQEDGTLPGERSVDKALVDEVEKNVVRAWQDMCMRMCRLTAESVLTTFFDNDLVQFERKSNTHASYLELRERLRRRKISPSTVSRLMGIYVQIQDLPEEVGEKLSYSNHCELLPVKNLRMKKELAKLTVDEGLTTDQLRAERTRIEMANANKSLANDPKRGRPPLHPWVKGINGIWRTASRAVQQFLKEEYIDGLTRAQAQSVLDKIEEVLATLEAAQTLVAKRIGPEPE